MGASPGPRWIFRIFLLLGAGVMVFGTTGLLIDARDTQPIDWTKWFLGGLVAHDLLVAPLVFAAAALVVGRIPLPVRTSIQGGLFTSGVMILIAFPFVRGYGRSPSNPSALPNAYGRNLLIVLLVVWVIVALASYRACGVRERRADVSSARWSSR
jgi:hypothetical protein